MKKFIISVLLVLAVVTSAFAQQNVALYGAPYSLNFADESTVDPNPSAYGFGGMIDYRINPFLDSKFFAGASFSANGYIFENQDSDYVVLSVMARAGYRFQFFDNFSVSPLFGVGIDVDLFGEKASACFVMGPSIDITYTLFANVDVILELQGAFSFPRNSETLVQYASYRITPYIGATYKF